jgi:hypothetical protein
MAYPSAGRDANHDRRCRLLQSWRGPIKQIRPGDLVWYPPRKKHWHGNHGDDAHRQRGTLKGKAVDWMEKVSDEQCQPYSPLGKGFLTGKINEDTTFDSPDIRNILPRFTPEARKENQALVDLLGKIAERKKTTPAQIALAWLLAQKPWIVPIPGTRKLERLNENIGAVAVELTSDDLREIDSAASKITVEGARYPEHLERMTGR